MQNQERIWYLLGRKLAGEATGEELEELEELLRKNPDMTYSVDIMSDMWQKNTPNSRKDKKEVEDAFDRHLRRMAKKNVATDAQQPPALQRSTQTPWQNPPKKMKLFAAFNSNGMLNNYFKVTRRNLIRNKTFSLINITGLAIGMASAMLILLWIQHQLSVDQFHTKKERIYQVYNRGVFNGQVECWGATPHIMAPTLESEFPQVEATARLNWVGAFVFSVGDKHLETSGFITDPGFFTLFDFPLVQGDPKTALSSVHSIVLTEKSAKRLFGDANALGKMIKVDSNALFTVTGVMKNLPSNTQFNFEYLIPWSYTKEVGWDNTNWDNNSIRTFVLLKPGVSEQTANNLFRNISKSHQQDVKNEVFVHPMAKWYLWSDFKNGESTGGNIETVKLFGFIAGFILLIACINYMNLSTARSVKRAKEVGIRKVVGAGKASLIWQFLGESILISLLAGILALIIVQPALRGFGKLVDTDLSIPYTSGNFWLAALGFVLLTGIIAGSYPAFYLSAFKPISVLKGTFKIVHALVTPRKVLVVVQFSFAIILIICTIVIYRQINYTQKRDSGYSRNDLAFVYIKGDIKKHYAIIRDELINSGAVTGVTRTNSPITYIWSSSDDYEWKGKDPGSRQGFVVFNADKDFTETMGLKLIAGRDFDTDLYPSDSSAILVTESAAKMMGFTNPVGQTVKDSEMSLHIVGVVKDFIPGSPFDRMDPIIIHGFRPWYGALTFKFNKDNSTKENLAKIGAIFKKYNPDYPFEYYFVDKAYSEKFEYAENVGTLSSLFAGLTIFISCLGLFALAAYMAENRIKEIGVRKVLGASVTAITTLLSKDFLKLILISFAIASPLAWWAMDSWLQNYAYRVSISWWVFVLTGVISMLIAIGTISYQSIKAALANPIKALRAE